MPLQSPNLLYRSLGLCVAIVVLLIAGTLTSSAAQLQNQTALELSKPIARTINAREADSYTLTLTSGLYAHLTVG